MGQCERTICRHGQTGIPGTKRKCARNASACHQPGKFDAERIAKAVKAFGVEDKVGHKRLIIPGQVAVLSGELEEELPGWEIMVGPREAVDIASYLKTMWAN